jgi:hypothetical protein
MRSFANGKSAVSSPTSTVARFRADVLGMAVLSPPFSCLAHMRHCAVQARFGDIKKSVSTSTSITADRWHPAAEIAGQRREWCVRRIYDPGRQCILRIVDSRFFSHGALDFVVCCALRGPNCAPILGWGQHHHQQVAKYFR